MFVKIVNTPRYFIACIVGWTCLCGTSFHLIERKSMITAVYWAIVTGSGVGYGDLYPTHVAGRLITMFYIASMIFLVVPLITAQFASKLIVNRDAWTDEEQEEVKLLLRDNHQRLKEMEHRHADLWALLDARAPGVRGPDENSRVRGMEAQSDRGVGAAVATGHARSATEGPPGGE